MATKVYTFASNRGGSGKSTLTAQTAAAIAFSNPTKNIVVLDFSIQADCSVSLLGGIAEPQSFTAGISTRGMENMAGLPATKSARAFILAAREFAAATAVAPATGSWWRGSVGAQAVVGNALTNTAFDWQANVVNVNATFPAGLAPHNLYIAPGGPELNNMFPLDDTWSVAGAMRSALKSTPKDTIFIIDTDAELAERCSSVLGLCLADGIVVVTSASWQDTQRLVSDPVNALFAGLDFISSKYAGFSGKINTICFNQIAKASKDPVGPLPFSPPQNTIKMIQEISNYLATHPLASKHFQSYPEVSSIASDFYNARVTAIATMPDGTKLKTLESGIPVVLNAKTDADVTVANNINALAARFVL